MPLSRAQPTWEALCSWVVEQMHPLAEEKHIEIRVHTACLTALIDTARMKQVLVNVIDNAIKYTLPGGSIELTTFSAEGVAVVEVVDTGIGIPAADLPHVFDRFFRADTVRSRGSGGAGLGLSIVKAICNAHGGFDCHSKARRGLAPWSAFSFRLPSPKWKPPQSPFIESCCRQADRWVRWRTK